MFYIESIFPLTQEFSTFGFWKDGLPEIDLDDLAEIIPQSQEDTKNIKP